MKNPSLVAAAAQALLSGYVAWVLATGARTAARRTLSRALGFIALYGVFVVTAYVLDEASSWLPIMLSLTFGFLGSIELASFAWWYAGGRNVAAAPSLPFGATNALRAVALALGVWGLAIAAPQGDVSVPFKVLSLISLGLLGAMATAFLVAAQRGVRGSRGFIVACACALAPVAVSIGVQLGVPVPLGWLRVVRDVGLLLFVVMILESYANEGHEPMSLKDRMISIVLTVLLGFATVSSHLLHADAATDTDNDRVAYRLLATMLCAAVLVVAFAPMLFRARILGPLDRLGAGLARAEAGGRTEIVVDQNDELGGVTMSFNRMSGALADSRAALEDRLAQLEARRVEVEALNDELRRQVAARSRHLAELLARDDAPGASIATGTLVDGRYRVGEKLGAGGMGVVYDVTRVTDGRALALKVMLGGTRDDALRFTREAEIAAGLADDHLVGVLDVGMYMGAPYLVMERMDGGALADRADRFGDAAFVLPLLGHVARGLATLHARGILHRDIKPQNVLLSGSDPPVAKISDFGIARAPTPAELAATMGEEVSALAATDRIGSQTRTGGMMGTILYMAPELARGAVGPAADVFAFGILAFEVLGTTAFRVPPVLEALACAPISEPGPPPANVPERIASILARATRLDPAARPAASELAEIWGQVVATR